MRDLQAFPMVRKRGNQKNFNRGTVKLSNLKPNQAQFLSEELESHEEGSLKSHLFIQKVGIWASL